MEKKQYDLCLEVLRRLNKAGVLKDLIVIGSWCIPFYREYFHGASMPAIKTRDIDFLVPNPLKIKHEVDIPALLKDLGFIINFQAHAGYVRLEHPELLIEFLVPEKGRGADKPYQLPKLGVNAVALRFLNFLYDNTIRIEFKDFYVTLPHPANFALHKLIIFQRRANPDKAIKDRNAAIEILKALINKGELKSIKHVFKSVPLKWQNKIIKGLKEAKEEEILSAICPTK